MTENKDYKLIESCSDSSHYAILCTSGEYDGIIYRYTSVVISELPNEAGAKISYSYEIEKGNELYEDISDLKTDADFKNHLDKILNTILTNAYAKP